MESSVSNVQFTERKRGYDPEEVGNYLAHIDDKIAGLRSIAAEAVERAEQAEERARVAEQRAAADDGPAQAAAVLAMAQQTADATVSQARADADALLAGAQQEIEQRRRTAEAEAEEMLSGIRRDLEVRRAEHFNMIHREIEDLVTRRDELAADVTALELFLADQRTRVLEARDALTRIAEDPSALRAGDVPAVGDDQGVDGDVIEEIIVEDVVVTDADTGEVLAEATFLEASVVQPVEPGGDEVPWGSADPDATAAVPMGTALFDDDAVDDPGDVAPGEDEAGLFGDAPRGDTVFGSVDQEDDEAMRAFFEGDAEEEDRSSRWGFRRR